MLEFPSTMLMLASWLVVRAAGIGSKNEANSTMTSTTNYANLPPGGVLLEFPAMKLMLAK